MDFYLFRPHKKRRITHTPNQALRKCCGCIHLRVGSAIACIIWASLSMYFAVVSFQGSSPFFSSLIRQALVVFGVVNLLLSLVSLLALGALFLDIWEYIRTAQHSLFFCIFIVLIDGIINVILFITERNKYIAWCIDGGSRTLEGLVNNPAVSGEHDFYNCSRTWEDELKFGLLSILMMIGFYIYWAMCFRSYRIKKAIIISSMVGAPIERHAVPSMGGGVPPLGPPPMMGGAAMPMQRMGGNGRPNIIVLNNQKPSGKDKKDPSPPPPPYGP